jgi:NTP pyrophosphatase (non-canonical NTP hydrolase)
MSTLPATPGSGAASDSAFGSDSGAGSGAVDTLTELRALTRAFAAERDWQQFHTPKNLAMALSVEVAELVEHFQWLPTGELDELDERKREGIRHEMADVLLYVVQLADRMGVDLKAAALEKLRMNGEKYPAEKVKGDARKYDEY